MEKIILKMMQEISNESNIKLSNNINKDFVLLDSGLDSLGFAILIARLEEELGYDPFTMMDEPVYPQTFGQLVQIYQRFSQ
jgi:hypothetical protein